MEKDLSRSAILGSSSRRIQLEEAIASKHQIIDVRSAAEYHSGTIPGAINIPLFDEDERAVIGTIYRHGGHEQAVEKGFEYVDKKLTALLEGFKPHSSKQLTIFCARGGMRSLSVVNLLLQSGYKAFQLEGGYKKFRQQTLDCLERFQPKLIVIHGLTGTGKTRILQLLEGAIDLEDLAGHRSSLFGGLDRQPSNQKTFESGLAEVIRSLQVMPEPYFIEGESRKIGRVFMPQPLAMAMQNAVLVNVDCSLDTRIERIIEDYPVADEEMCRQIEIILKTLKQRLGTEMVERMCQLLWDGNLYELVRILLVDYYDIRYRKSMSKYSFDLQLSSENIEDAAVRLTNFRQSLL